MSHRNLALVSLESLHQLLDVIFEDESVRSSSRLIELTSDARVFLTEAQKELKGLVKEYDDLKAKIYPLENGERK